MRDGPSAPVVDPLGAWGDASELLDVPERSDADRAALNRSSIRPRHRETFTEDRLRRMNE
jgi:hypothetical protein